MRYLPTVTPTQDERFAQPPRPPETGLHASIVRYMLGAGQAVRWGYVYPATLLREEILTRLEPLLTDEGAGSPIDPAPTIEQIATRVGQRTSPRAAELTRTLLSDLRRLDRGQKNVGGTSHPSTAHISSSQLLRWHQQATELFAELQAAANRRREVRP